jgi:uncharacterized membrane protein
MSFAKFLKLFSLGGSAYVALELLWRGRSHYSMFLAGGLCQGLLGLQEVLEPRPPRILRVLIGSGVITMVELGTGLVFNRDYSVWDYRAMPFNFQGQICAMFTLLWIPVSIMAMALYDVVDRKI